MTEHYGPSRKGEAPTELLSTRQVADALGIGVSTVKRWVDDGILPAQKTPGGHRKLFLADVLRLAREGRLPHVDLERLPTGPSRADGVDPGRQARELQQALEAGDAFVARSIIHGAYVAGTSIDQLGDQIIGPAMERIGHGWEMQRLDVMHEHRATQLCIAALFELKAMLERSAGTGRPIAVGGAPEGDPTTLGNLMVQLLLLDSGWHPINLGANTPFRSFELALKELKPSLVWISSSHLPDRERFIREFPPFFQAAQRDRIPVAVGGGAFDKSLLAQIPYTMYGAGLSQFASFVRALHPTPQPPKRGRPPLEKPED